MPAELPPGSEKLIYDVEWRLIHAGTAVVDVGPSSIKMKLESAGLVTALFKIDDLYTVNFQDTYCVTSSLLDAMEGKHHRETKITYDRVQRRAFFVERDLLTESIVRKTDVETPNCVHDPLVAMKRIREMKVEPGQTVQVPVSDGRRSAEVKAEALGRENIKTAAGSFKTIKYEAGLLNGVVYTRKGRLFVWLSDDARRLPVRIQLRMSFPLGTVTLDLQKQERL